MFSRPMRVACVGAVVATAFAQGATTSEAAATAAPATTEAPAQVALEKAEEAENQYATLRDQVVTAVKQYEEVATAFNESAGIDDQATRVEDAVKAKFGDAVDAAHDRWEQAKDALENWDGTVTTIKGLGEEVEKAGEAMEKTDEEFAEETHKEVERSRSTMEKQATGPGDQLEKQAEKLLEARDPLEKAQIKAGAKELGHNGYEKQSGRHEKEAEHLKLRVQKARAMSGRKVEKFWGNVGKKVQPFEKRVRDAGKQYKHKVKEELEAAKKAEEEATKEAEADKKDDDGKDGPDGSDADTQPEGPNAVALAQVETVGGGASLSLFAIAAVAFSVMGFRSQRSTRFWNTSPAERPLLG